MCVTAFLPSLRSRLSRVSLFPDRIHQDPRVPADHLTASFACIVSMVLRIAEAYLFKHRFKKKKNVILGRNPSPKVPFIFLLSFKI